MKRRNTDYSAKKVIKPGIFFPGRHGTLSIEDVVFSDDFQLSNSMINKFRSIKSKDIPEHALILALIQSMEGKKSNAKNAAQEIINILDTFYKKFILCEKKKEIARVIKKLKQNLEEIISAQKIDDSGTSKKLQEKFQEFMETYVKYFGDEKNKDLHKYQKSYKISDKQVAQKILDRDIKFLINDVFKHYTLRGTFKEYLANKLHAFNIKIAPALLLKAFQSSKEFELRFHLFEHLIYLYQDKHFKQKGDISEAIKKIVTSFEKLDTESFKKIFEINNRQKHKLDSVLIKYMNQNEDVFNAFVELSIKSGVCSFHFLTKNLGFKIEDAEKKEKESAMREVKECFDDKGKVKKGMMPNLRNILKMFYDKDDIGMVYENGNKMYRIISDFEEDMQNTVLKNLLSAMDPEILYYIIHAYSENITVLTEIIEDDMKSKIKSFCEIRNHMNDAKKVRKTPEMPCIKKIKKSLVDAQKEGYLKEALEFFKVSFDNGEALNRAVTNEGLFLVRLYYEYVSKLEFSDLHFNYQLEEHPKDLEEYIRNAPTIACNLRKGDERYVNINSQNYKVLDVKFDDKILLYIVLENCSKNRAYKKVVEWLVEKIKEDNENEIKENPQNNIVDIKSLLDTRSLSESEKLYKLILSTKDRELIHAFLEMVLLEGSIDRFLKYNTSEMLELFKGKSAWKIFELLNSLFEKRKLIHALSDNIDILSWLAKQTLKYKEGRKTKDLKELEKVLLENSTKNYESLIKQNNEKGVYGFLMALLREGNVKKIKQIFPDKINEIISLFQTDTEKIKDILDAFLKVKQVRRVQEYLSISEKIVNYNPLLKQGFDKKNNKNIEDTLDSITGFEIVRIFIGEMEKVLKRSVSQKILNKLRFCENKSINQGYRKALLTCLTPKKKPVKNLLDAEGRTNFKSGSLVNSSRIKFGKKKKHNSSDGQKKDNLVYFNKVLNEKLEEVLNKEKTNERLETLNSSFQGSTLIHSVLRHYSTLKNKKLLNDESKLKSNENDLPCQRVFKFMVKAIRQYNNKNGSTNYSSALEELLGVDHKGNKGVVVCKLFNLLLETRNTLGVYHFLKIILKKGDIEQIIKIKSRTMLSLFKGDNLPKILEILSSKTSHGKKLIHYLLEEYHFSHKTNAIKPKYQEIMKWLVEQIACVTFSIKETGNIKALKKFFGIDSKGDKGIVIYSFLLGAKSPEAVYTFLKMIIMKCDVGHIKTIFSHSPDSMLEILKNENDKITLLLKNMLHVKKAKQNNEASSKNSEQTEKNLLDILSNRRKKSFSNKNSKTKKNDLLQVFKKFVAKLVEKVGEESCKKILSNIGLTVQQNKSLAKIIGFKTLIPQKVEEKKIIFNEMDNGESNTSKTTLKKKFSVGPLDINKFRGEKVKGKVLKIESAREESKDNTVKKMMHTARAKSKEFLQKLNKFKKKSETQEGCNPNRFSFHKDDDYDGTGGKAKKKLFNFPIKGKSNSIHSFGKTSKTNKQGYSSKNTKKKSDNVDKIDYIKDQSSILNEKIANQLLYAAQNDDKEIGQSALRFLAEQGYSMDRTNSSEEIEQNSPEESLQQNLFFTAY